LVEFWQLKGSQHPSLESQQRVSADKDG